MTTPMLHQSTPADLKARLEAERAGIPFLLFRERDGRQRIVRLDDELDAVTIGRRPDNDIALPWDGRLSRLHARLERLAGEWTVVDDGLSHNGTFVDGQRVLGRRRLRGGDTLRLGDTVMAFFAPRRSDLGATVADSSAAGIARIPDGQRRVLVALCRPLLETSGFATPATNRQIAEELFLSVEAVKTHLRLLFRTFELDDVPQNEKRARLAERAIRIAIVTPRDVQS
jgi:hypothetical protein